MSLFQKLRPRALSLARPSELPTMPEDIRLARPTRRFNWKRLFFSFFGLALFLFLNYFCQCCDAVDPSGRHFALTSQGRGALGLFLLAAVWWLFEVVPIGVTAIAVGVFQVLFLIRAPKAALGDFMDPSVWFIIGSVVMGMAFTRTGLTKRIAYRMLLLVGERTSMVYLGCVATIALLTLIMAHTAVAAAVFPLMMAINSLYDESGKPTRFGRSLFIGMAFVCAAGSTVTLLGSARAAIALGFFREITGHEETFLKLSYYMLPVGWGIVLLMWGFLTLFTKPEQKSIPGLSARAAALYRKLGPISRNEIGVIFIALFAITLLSLHSILPLLKPLDKSAVILLPTLCFFMFNILSLRDLEEIPWNIVLLFGGAMSIGLCLWQTGCAQWIAVKCLPLLQPAPWYIFVLGIAFIVLIMTNFIINVATIAITLPVGLIIAKYLGVPPELVFYSSLLTAGMPFLLLIGAAPNAIAYESRQFTYRQFMAAGIPASILVMLILALFLMVLWPLMGMPVAVTP